MAELDSTSDTFCVSIAPSTESKTLPPQAFLCRRLSPSAVRARARNMPVFLAHSSRSSRPKTIMSRSFPRHTRGSLRCFFGGGSASPAPPRGQCGCVQAGTRQNGAPPRTGTSARNAGSGASSARLRASSRAREEGNARHASKLAIAASWNRARTRSPRTRARRAPTRPHPSIGEASGAGPSSAPSAEAGRAFAKRLLCMSPRVTSSSSSSSARALRGSSVSDAYSAPSSGSAAGAGTNANPGGNAVCATIVGVKSTRVWFSSMGSGLAARSPHESHGETSSRRNRRTTSATSAAVTGLAFAFGAAPATFTRWLTANAPCRRIASMRPAGTTRLQAEARSPRATGASRTRWGRTVASPSSHAPRRRRPRRRAD